jgi:hypothetical protein
MNKIIFISDYFIDEILGGAEKCNDALIQYLSKDFSVKKIKSRFVNAPFILENKDSFFIVANFFELSEDIKKQLQQNCNYIIYEHDHKYISTNNPIFFKNFLAPEKYIINKEFFSNANNVICQSKLHAETLYKNLVINNIINAGGNFWSQEDLIILQKNINSKKQIEYASMQTDNKNKGMNKAILFAKSKKFDLSLIPLTRYENFIETLAKVENFVFFPQWMESYSRVAIEARILNCKMITNRLLGAASEDYFKLTGQDLLDKIKQNNFALIDKIKSIINGEPVHSGFEPKSIPKITISCSVYDGDKYISHFLEDIVRQTIFDKCELIVVNANSPGNEEEIILEYCNKYPNIQYHKLDYRATTTEVINMVISDLATGDFITVGNIDDRRRYDCLEIQAKYLMFNEDIDLIYGDCLQTKKINETFINNSSNGSMYEHSKNKFSKENMIKCLPGPMPMWRKNIHDEIGLFSHEYNYANDWDMWLRMVDSGKKFMKIEESLGLYLFNEEGRSTSVDNFKYKIKEESKLFFQYKHIFGENNFNLYKTYFSQGVTND